MLFSRIMLFTEFYFIFYFLPVTLAVFALLRKLEHRLLFIFLASLFFYGVWDYRFVPLLLGSIVFNWWLGEKIQDSDDEKKRYRMTAAAVVTALIPLIFFKYSAFIAKNLDLSTSLYTGVLPLGISFYTFQQITYIINIYKRRFPASRSFLKYAFIVTFFPHLIAGPILFYKDIVGQIGQVVDRNRFFAEGIVYFVIGFFKKFLVADNIALLVTPVFTAAAKGEVTMIESITATLGYTLQLYFDFSGYSDMAVGLGLMFGYRLPINFDSPYKSTSISDFWRRWHITLSNFLRDYVYIPLGGNKKGETRRYGNLLMTMLIGGLWHGANWTFIVWGGVHGLALAVNHAFAKTGIRLPSPLGWALTFTFTALAWVLFRAETFDGAMNIYRSYFGETGEFKPGAAHLWMLLGLAMIFMPNSHRIAERLPEAYLALGGAFRRFMEQRVLIYVVLSQILWLPVIMPFYTEMTDKKAYREFNVARSEQGINNRVGDYRSNFFTNATLTGDERKILIAGSSYTQNLGYVSFDLNGEKYKSGTLGMGGNNITVPMRTAFEALETPNLEVLIVGVSALNMMEIGQMRASKVRDRQRANVGAFPYQCVDSLRDAGLLVAKDWLASCRPDQDFGILKIAAAATVPALPIFFQFHGFMQKLSTIDDSNASKPAFQHIELTKAEEKRFAKEMKEWKATEAAAGTPTDSENGSEKNFKWSNRKTLKAIGEGGEVYRTLELLKKKADEKNVKLVIYSSPTVMHKDATWVYPEGYHEKYQAEMKSTAKKLGIRFYDYSDYYPWVRSVMFDFIHPTEAAGKRFHKVLLYRLYTDGVLK